MISKTSSITLLAFFSLCQFVSCDCIKADLSCPRDIIHLSIDSAEAPLFTGDDAPYEIDSFAFLSINSDVLQHEIIEDHTVLIKIPSSGLYQLQFSASDIDTITVDMDTYRLKCCGAGIGIDRIIHQGSELCSSFITCENILLPID